MSTEEEQYEHSNDGDNEHAWLIHRQSSSVAHYVPAATQVVQGQPRCIKCRAAIVQQQLLQQLNAQGSKPLRSRSDGSGAWQQLIL